MPSIGQFSALKVPEANLPAVTYGMVVDFLGKDCVIYGPDTSKRVFRWLKVREGLNQPKTFEQVSCYTFAASSMPELC